MTDIDKSDAQLDAEAAAIPADLAERIEHHRNLYAAELNRPLTTSRVPSDLERIEERVKVGEDWLATGVSWAVLDTGELGGPALSPQMVGRLTEPPYGSPWQAALFALADTCRRRHPDHTSPGGRHGLCWHLVFRVIIVGRDLPDWFDDKLLPDPARTARTLAAALRFIEDHIEVRLRREVDRKAREEQRSAQVGTVERTWEHHSVPGLHAEDCPNLECRRAA